MSRQRTTTRHDRMRGVFEAQWTRRAALRTAGVFAIDAMLAEHDIGSAIAQEGTPVAGAATADYPELVMIAADFSFALPASVPAGFTRLTMRNEGNIDHHAMFMRVNDDATLDELEAALAQPALGPIFAVAQSLGGPEVGPGGEASVIADLLPGQYMVICVIPEADGTPHYLMGMQAPLAVTEPAGEASPPQAALTVDLIDFAFEMPAMEIAAGPQIWEAPNVGEQIHELVVLQLAPDVAFDEAQAALQAFAPTAATPDSAVGESAALSGPPPFASVGGVAPMNPGYTNWAVLDLAAGDYIANCFVPDPATGMPHFALGMMMPFTVG